MAKYNYKWDNDDIKRKLEEAKDDFDIKNIDIEKIEEKGYTIEALQELVDDIGIKSIKNNIPSINFSPDYTFDDLKETFDLYNTSFQKDFVTTSYEISSPYDLDKYSKKPQKKYLPLGLGLNFAGKVFTDLDGNKDDFKKMINPNNHYLRLSPFHRNYFSSTTKDAYISLRYKDSIKAFLCAIHELGHYFEYCLDCDKYYNKPDNYCFYSEIISILFELLGIEKLGKQGIITEEDKKELGKYVFNINSSDAGNYLRLLDIASGDYATLKDKFFIKAHQGTIFNTAYYYSYVLAINFLNQFNQDEKQALGNLKRLLMNYSKEDEIDLLEKCEIDLEGEVLKKHLDKLKRSN